MINPSQFTSRAQAGLSTPDSKRLFAFVSILFVILAALHFYAAVWYDVGRQHDPSIHFAVLRGIVNLEAFPSYNSPYYYLVVGIVSSPFAALYRLHIIGDATYMALAAMWSGLVFHALYSLSCLMLARALRFRISEQMLFVGLCAMLPPVQRTFLMLRPENLILVLAPLACALVIGWWRSYRNGVAMMQYPAAYPTLIALSFMAAQKITGAMLVVALWGCMILFMGGHWKQRVLNIIRPSLILLLMCVGLLGADKLSSGVSIVEHHASERADHQHTPSLSVFTTIDLSKAWQEPLRNNHADSMINILVIDLFGDYWQYGILQGHGQSQEWQVFRARIGLIISVGFVGLYLLAVFRVLASAVHNNASTILSWERVMLSALFGLSIVTLIMAALTYYKPSKFDIIKWEYVIMYIPFMMIPLVSLLSCTRSIALRRVLFFVLVLCVGGGFVQSIWIDPVAALGF
ncbi:MAG: hypothetical protein OQK24_07640 [Magnetovibrio sp.]|nr:hypothetical protein [Magnetovibrio sp.]